jgi:hypothetical protein
MCRFVRYKLTKKSFPGSLSHPLARTRCTSSILSGSFEARGFQKLIRIVGSSRAAVSWHCCRNVRAKPNETDNRARESLLRATWPSCKSTNQCRTRYQHRKGLGGRHSIFPLRNDCLYYTQARPRTTTRASFVDHLNIVYKVWFCSVLRKRTNRFSAFSTVSLNATRSATLLTITDHTGAVKIPVESCTHFIEHVILWAITVRSAPNTQAQERFHPFCVCVDPAIRAIPTVYCVLDVE